MMMMMVMMMMVGVTLIMKLLTCAQLAVELEPSQHWLDLALVPDSEPEALSLPFILFSV